jgi:hypothetical protein
MPRHNVGLKLLRALSCVPSRVSVCAHLTGHGSIGSGGAALTLETGAELQIGPKNAGEPKSEPVSIAKAEPLEVGERGPVMQGRTYTLLGTQ